MDAQDIVARASTLIGEGDGAEAVRVLEPLWAANRSHQKLNRMMSAARVAAARAAYGTGEHETALAQLNLALSHDPDYPPVRAHRAIVALRQGRPSDAEADFDAAMQAAGDASGPHGWIWTQAASLARQAGDFDRAESLLDAYLAQAPDDPDAIYIKAFLDLAQGRFADGWDGYEGRWRVGGFASIEKPTGRSRWNGARTPDRLLIWREQGVGDEIMFARDLPAAAALAGETIVECDPRLVGLFGRSFPAIQFVPSAADLTPTRLPDEAFDVHLPIGSLRHTIAGTGANSAYLTPSPERTAEFRRRLTADAPNGTRVGISWWSKNAEHGHTRSPSPEQWLPLLNAPGLSFFSLQYQPVYPPEFEGRVRQIEGLDPWQDLDGLAAAMAALDHVVSIDNSTVHLAGALGVATEVLLPSHVDWRWQMAAAGETLYTSVRTHRQARPGDWAPVFAAVQRAVSAGD